MHEGEVFVGAQSVLFVGDESRPTVSISYVRRIHASIAPELDVGTFRQSTSILLSKDLRGFHFDTNGIIAEQVQGAVRQAQFGQTLSISHPLGKFTISGEVWHFSQPFEKGNTVGNLWAVSCSLRKNLVVDGGLDHGLTNTSTRREAFVGFTYLLPHRLLDGPSSKAKVAPPTIPPVIRAKYLPSKLLDFPPRVNPSLSIQARNKP